MHVPNLQRENGVRVTTVVSRGGSSAESLARSLNGARSSTDWREAVDAPDVDLVVVGTRHDTHAEIAAAALRAGKAVFVEKPLGLTREQIDDVWRAGDENDRLAIGFNRPFAPLSRTLAQQVHSLAGPLHVVYRMNAPVAPEHWLNDPLEGGGRILGEACHLFDYANWLCGTPQRVLAAAVPPPSGVTTPESASITVQYADGSVATIHYSGLGAASMPKERVEVLRGGRSWALDDFRTLTSFGADGTSDERRSRRQGARRAPSRRACRLPRRASVRARPRRRLHGAERGARRARVDFNGAGGGRAGAALMCGIAGILGTSDGFAVDEELVDDDARADPPPRPRRRRLVALARAAASRSGTAGSRSSTCRPAGHQPMSNEDGTVWITFDGEIYNHTDAAPELEAKGHRYRSHTDTETIVHLYEEEGIRCVERLHGMFALRDLGRAHARAPPRARPPRQEAALLRAARRAGFVFGSEIKALLAHPALTAELDEEAFFHYLTFVCTPAPMTMFKGIRKLAPAERMTVRADGSTEIETYWSALLRASRAPRSPRCDEPSSRSGCSRSCASRSGAG